MQKTLIKICGITDAATARAAVLSGVTFVGLVFDQRSPRNITISQASVIAQAIRKVDGIPVAVFVEQNATVMQNICEQLQINVVQLHGVVTRSTHHLLPSHYQRIYVVEPDEADDKDDIDSLGLTSCQVERDFILFDNKKNGGAIEFNTHQLEHDYCAFRCGIAGGLNANNVESVIKKCKFSPYFIDVSSGVEIHTGVKDIAQIKIFIEKVYACCDEGRSI